MQRLLASITTVCCTLLMTACHEPVHPISQNQSLIASWDSTVIFVESPSQQPYLHMPFPHIRAYLSLHNVSNDTIRIYHCSYGHGYGIIKPWYSFSSDRFHVIGPDTTLAMIMEYLQLEHIVLNPRDSINIALVSENAWLMDIMVEPVLGGSRSTSAFVTDDSTSISEFLTRVVDYGDIVFTHGRNEDTVHVSKRDNLPVRRQAVN